MDFGDSIPVEIGQSRSLAQRARSISPRRANRQHDCERDRCDGQRHASVETSGELESGPAAHEHDDSYPDHDAPSRQRDHRASPRPGGAENLCHLDICFAALRDAVGSAI